MRRFFFVVQPASFCADQSDPLGDIIDGGNNAESPIDALDRAVRDLGRRLEAVLDGVFPCGLQPVREVSAYLGSP